MSVRTLALASLATSLLVLVPSALADPNPANNKNAVERTLVCGGESFPSTFAGLEGSDFNISSGQQVFVYKWIHIDEIPIGVESAGDVTTNRGLQGISSERLVTCNYYTGTGAYVTAVGFFTGPSS
jgi:hypothetical protein